MGNRWHSTARRCRSARETWPMVGVSSGNDLSQYRPIRSREMGSAKEVLDELRAPTRELRKAAPDAWAGFAQMHDAAIADGALSRRIKELMALVIAVVKQCDGCIAAHAKAAALHGATPRRWQNRCPWPCSWMGAPPLSMDPGPGPPTRSSRLHRGSDAGFGLRAEHRRTEGRYGPVGG